MHAQYEFTAPENATISTTGARTRAWGAISILVGVGQLILGALALSRSAWVPALPNLVGGVVSIAVGAVFLGVAGELTAVVRTQGNDVALMMAALRKLSAAFTIQIIVTVIAFVAGFVAGLLGLAS